MRFGLHAFKTRPIEHDPAAAKPQEKRPRKQTEKEAKMSVSP
jgi:hypothetical protein